MAVAKWQHVEVKVANVNEDGTVTAIDDATSDTYTPTSEDSGDRLTAMATYTDAQGPEKTAEFAYTVAVAEDTRNKAPEFAADQDPETEGDQAEAERTIAENSVAPASVNGGPVMATDPNGIGDTLTYTLGGPDASSFDVLSNNGQIMVGAGTMLNYEMKPTYMVTVIATDSFGVSDSVDVVITVTDINEGPEIMIGGLAISGVSSVSRMEGPGTQVATYMAVGPEAASTMWSLSGDDAGDFNISPSGGVLTFRNSPDYENPADMDGDNVYMVTVMADDGTYTAERMVTVTVTEVDDSMVTPMPPGDTLLERYDDDDDGMINQAEVEEALADYFFAQTLSQEEVEDVLALYFFP